MLQMMDGGMASGSEERCVYEIGASNPHVPARGSRR
jgi:hypothetical protein